MRKYGNWDKVKAAAEFEQLPPGGYVCRIMGAEVKEYERKDHSGSFEKLRVSLDIAEGRYKDFYANDYRAQNTEDKRWRGVLGLYLPDENGANAEQEERTASYLKAAIEAIEESNSGYRWDWDERKLKGKIVGCLFRSKEWEYEGRGGWRTEALRFIEADRIRQGKFKVPAAKPLKKTSDSVHTAPMTTPENVEIIADDDLPF